MLQRFSTEQDTTMKMNMKLVLVAGVAGLAVTPLLAKPHAGHGTDILHFTIRETMTNEGIETNATGTVQASQAKQGNADNQKLDVIASGLTASTPYSLFVVTTDNTNLTDVADFSTDANGKVALHFRSLGNGHGGGHNKLALPVDSVSHLLELDIVNTNAQIVLSADATSPQSLQYLIKRDISTNAVSASLRIHGTTSTTQFELDASGLVATTDYLLVFNGTPVQTNTSDANGSLKITSAPTPTNILDLQSVALWDTSSNVVVTTTLP
jgi:hypothetical protein